MPETESNANYDASPVASDQDKPQSIHLPAQGKFIDTTPLRNLLTQGESLMDFVIFDLDRYYHYRDLSEFLFVIHGILPSGKQVATVLTAEMYQDELVVPWKVGREFTEEAGELRLTLCAYAYENSQKQAEFIAGKHWNTPLEWDFSDNPADYVLHYQLPAVTVREMPA